MQCTETIWTILKEDQPRTDPVKFGQIPISGLGDCLKIVDGRTDRRTTTTDGEWSQ